jgi:hypothetical protein
MHHGDSFQATCSGGNGQSCRTVGCCISVWTQASAESAESPLTTNNKKEDNPRVETLMKTRLLLLLVGFFALESACLAQGSKPGQSAPSTGPTTTAGDPAKYLNRDWENVYNQGRTGDHLRGNVILAEGALPAIPVVVMCDGKAQFTTTTFTRRFCDCACPAGHFYNNHRYLEVAGQATSRLFRLGTVARF